MKYRIPGIVILVFFYLIAWSQLTLTPSSQINTVCNGFGCNYNGPSILINEVMSYPSTGDGSMYGTNTSQRGEWIELYNPDLCKQVDVSCYFLGNCSRDGNGDYGGGYEIPPGTIIPSRGFLIVRGMNAPAVPTSLLVQNGGRTVERIIDGSSAVCWGTGGSRLWFPDVGGWFAFYNQYGVPQDAIKWGTVNASTLSGLPCNPAGGCPYGGALSNYDNIPASRKNIIDPNGASNAGLSYRRIPDGGNWVSIPPLQAAATYGTCNSTCAPAPVITCNGQASVTASGGTAPYSYAWNDGQLQTTQTAIGLCAGTYCCTVTDAVGITGNICITVGEYKPVVGIGTYPSVCVNGAPYLLTGGTPAAGTYTGVGVYNGVFNPSYAGAGVDTVKYIYVNSDGCGDTAAAPITVWPKPNIVFGSLSPFCQGSNPVTLMATPAGGTYSGTGISGSSFNPSVSGVGTFPITYIASNSFGCKDTAQQNIIVHALPSVSLGAFSPICSNAQPITLNTGSPAGGTYSGTGVSGTSFSPGNAGAGIHVITYAVVDLNGCSNSATQNITVNQVPTVTLTPFVDVCISKPAFTLSGGSPAGGTYTGIGITNNIFNPAVSGLGTFNITYHYTDANGCSNTAMHTLTVNNGPTVTLPPLSSTCLSTPAFALTGGLPAGGTYTGTGVSGGQFDPAVSGAGTFTINYMYVDADNCGDTVSQSITVYTNPTVTMAALNRVCANAPAFSLSGGLPAGGTFTGAGVSANIFTPSVAGAGTHTITYTFEDIHGCSGSDSRSITVVAIPVVNLPQISDVCANDTAFTLSGATPPGGTYSGTGVVAGTFNPDSMGPGTYNITYTFTDTTNCTASDSKTLIVRPLPNVQIGPFTDLCANSPPYQLNTGTPPGGTYSGTAVTGTTFTPGVSGTGTFVITYAVTDQYNCHKDTTRSLVVNPLPLAYTMTGGGQVCPGGDGTAVGLNNSESSADYQLFYNGTASGTPQTGSGSAFNFGNYIDTGYYYSTATDPLTGCTNSMHDSVFISFIKLPSVNIGDSLYLCDDAGIVLDAGIYNDTMQYIWLPDSATARYFTVSKPGKYTVKVGRNNCYSSASVDVKPCSILEVPNVFTPNSDGKNDYFITKPSGDILKFHIDVFNRWGKRVFSSDRINEGWDGTQDNTGSVCSDGVYYYIIKYSGQGNSGPQDASRLSGAVTLLR